MWFTFIDDQVDPPKSLSRATCFRTYHSNGVLQCCGLSLDVAAQARQPGTTGSRGCPLCREVPSDHAERVFLNVRQVELLSTGASGSQSREVHVHKQWVQISHILSHVASQKTQPVCLRREIWFQRSCSDQILVRLPERIDLSTEKDAPPTTTTTRVPAGPIVSLFEGSKRSDLRLSLTVKGLPKRFGVVAGRGGHAR